MVVGSSLVVPDAVGASTINYNATQERSITPVRSSELARMMTTGTLDSFADDVVEAAKRLTSRPRNNLSDQEWAEGLLPYIVNARD